MSFLNSIPLPLMHILFAIMAVPLFHYADRQVGGDHPNPKSTGYGPVFIYVALTLALGSFLQDRVLLFLGEMALGWIVYRSLPWKVGGSMTPRTVGEKIGSFLRHCMPAMLAVALYILGGKVVWAMDISPYVPLPFLAYGLFATVLAIDFAHATDFFVSNSEPLEDVNAKQETDRGLAFGLMMLLGGVLV